LKKNRTIGFAPLFLCVAVFLAAFPIAGWTAESEDLPEVPVKGMVTLLDFGADNCIPCKMLAPIIKELKSEYKGKAAIYFVHVGRHKALATRHGIRVIPTLVFFDAKGQEKHRFEGYLDKHFIKKYLEKMGLN